MGQNLQGEGIERDRAEEVIVIVILQRASSITSGLLYDQRLVKTPTIPSCSGCATNLFWCCLNACKARMRSLRIKATAPLRSGCGTQSTKGRRRLCVGEDSEQQLFFLAHDKEDDLTAARNAREVPYTSPAAGSRQYGVIRLSSEESLVGDHADERLLSSSRKM